jgi:predicted AlkP superfamily phosphohydrolase/phosphomutase
VSVLGVVLDAADGTLLRRWAHEGELPVLARMLAEGASARLESSAGVMPEAAWPTLTTGADPGSHGVYNWRPVRPGTYQRTRQPPAAWRKTFWHLLRDEAPGARAVVLDPPFSLPLRDDRFTEVVGWGDRGGVHHVSWPPRLLDEIVERHGRFPRWTEDDYVRWPREEKRLLRALEDAVERRTTIMIELLGRADWDVGLACYYELHDGGHAFYRYLDAGAPGHDARRAAFGQAALLRLYKAADTGLGRLRQAIGDDADMIVCSPKGFRANTNGEAVLPAVLEGLGHQVPRSVSGGSRRIAMARGLVRAVAPRPLRRRIFGRMSWRERDRILEQLWIQSVDWARTRAFAEPDLGSGFIRLNVRGREPEGIVEPGDEYERLIAELQAELLSLTHAATGAPAVARVFRREELAPGPNAGKLPDLLVAWTPEVLLDAVHHPSLGTVHERLKDLPTAEHTGDAFLIGTGPSFRPGAASEDARLTDVAPTLLHLAGAALPEDMDGRPLAELFAPSVPGERRTKVDWTLDPWELSPEP